MFKNIRSLKTFVKSFVNLCFVTLCTASSGNELTVFGTLLYCFRLYGKVHTQAIRSLQAPLVVEVLPKSYHQLQQQLTHKSAT